MAAANLAPYDLTQAVIGTGLLWVGWFGFNGGSALGANSRAAMAIVSTHLAASAGAFTWMALEWWTRGKPSVLGMISGAVAGLGTITPASGFVLPMQGPLIGIIAGAICFWACTWLKLKLGYDDSLDVFGVNGVGGFTGTLLAGVLAVGAISASPEMPGGVQGLLEGTALWHRGHAGVAGSDDFHHPQSHWRAGGLARASGGRGHGSRRQPVWRSPTIRADYFLSSL
jgi:Amt family ammonium transporter